MIPRHTNKSPRGRLLQKLEFETILFFFSHWHKIIPKNIDYCTKNGIFDLLQQTVLSLLHRTQYWPQERQDEFKHRRLGYFLRQCYGNSLCNETCISASDRHIVDHFSTLPLMTREDLRNVFIQAIEDFVHIYGSTKGLLLGSTSGTAGIPMRIAVTEELEVQYRILRRRLFEFAGMRPSEEFIYPRTTKNPHFCDKNVYLASDLAALVTQYKDFLGIIKREKITGIYAFPSFLLLLQEQLREYADVELSPLKAIFAAGEDLASSMQKSLGATLGAKVYRFYASVELSSVAQECEVQDGLHINPEFHVIEILSETGIVLSHGNWGRIIITQLDLSIAPIIRYDTGDIGMLSFTPCPCGRTLPRLYIRGRKPEVIHTQSGAISPFAFKDIIEEFDKNLDKIKQYQLILEKGGRKLILAVLPRDSFSQKDQRVLEETCKWFIQNKIEFELRMVDSLERKGLKTPVFIRKE